MRTGSEKMWRRGLSLALTIIMLMSCVSIGAFAEDDCSHVPGEAVYENFVDPDCTTDGSHDVVIYCSVCGEELSRETVTDPAAGHTEEEPAIENTVAATATEDGSHDEVVYCSVCGEELSRKTVTDPAKPAELMKGEASKGLMTSPTPGQTRLAGAPAQSVKLTFLILDSTPEQKPRSGVTLYIVDHANYEVMGPVVSDENGIAEFDVSGLGNGEYEVVQDVADWTPDYEFPPYPFTVKNGHLFDEDNNEISGTVEITATTVIFYVTYDANGGKIEGKPACTYATDSDDTHVFASDFGPYAVIPVGGLDPEVYCDVTAPKGYELDGWYTEKSGGKMVEENKTRFYEQETTIYARWKHEIIFNPNGGSGSISYQTFIYGEPQKLSKNSFTSQDGKIFIGWNTKADGTGTSYGDGEQLTNPTASVLYAQWGGDRLNASYEYTGGSDPHTQYPTSMSVTYERENADGSMTAEAVPELDNILQYSGTSIRITGNRGIRMITSVPTEAKNALTSGGLAGFTLEEYGTIVGWADELQGGELTMDNATGGNYAYKKGTADPIFAIDGGLTQYTNVLVGFTDDMVPRDLIMRSYMILSRDSKTYTLYGGPVQRSIGYVAWQNRDVFQPGSNEYEYVWNLIHIAYGKAYDAEYKH